MKKLVFGSLNIDRTYWVDHFVGAGETLAASGMELYRGGKGFNQAVAMARAGSEVFFAGAVGQDGDFLLSSLRAEHIDISHIKRTDGASGHAVIQVDKTGGNCIMVLPGANGEISLKDVNRVLSDFGSGDLLILQNEISNLPYIISQAHKRGMIIALNPSPISDTLAYCELDCVDCLILNEVEGSAIGGGSSWRETLDAIHEKYKRAGLLLTLGSRGSVYMEPTGKTTACGIYSMLPVDSTAAGDCFTGYFLTMLYDHGDVEVALRTAAIASGISVSRPGASPSIPTREEVETAEMSRLIPFAE